jgi:hypothetical protein
MNSSGKGQGLAASSCEHGNDPLDSTCQEFFD